MNFREFVFTTTGVKADVDFFERGARNAGFTERKAGAVGRIKKRGPVGFEREFHGREPPHQILTKRNEEHEEWTVTKGSFLHPRSSRNKDPISVSMGYLFL